MTLPAGAAKAFWIVCKERRCRRVALNIRERRQSIAFVVKILMNRFMLFHSKQLLRFQI